MRPREAGQLGALGADLGGELGNRAVLDRGSRLRLGSSSVRSVRTSRRVARAAPAGAGVLVPGAGEAGDVGAPAVSVRGEHRADAAGLRVDVGADDDPVGVDAAQHRLLGVARKALDGDAQAAARGRGCDVASREWCARWTRSVNRGRTGRILQETAMTRHGFWSRRSAMPATHSRRSAWRGRSPREGTRWWLRPGSGGGSRSRAPGWGSRRRRSTRRFPLPRRAPARGRRRPTRRWRCCRCSSASGSTWSSATSSRWRRRSRPSGPGCGGRR